MSGMESKKIRRYSFIIFIKSDFNVYLKTNMNLDKQFEQRSVNADLPATLTFESTFLPDSADGFCSLQMEMFTEIGTL